MRIAIVTEFFPIVTEQGATISGGVESHCYYLAQALSKEHQVTVYTSFIYGPAKRIDHPGFEVMQCGRLGRYSQKGGYLRRATLVLEASRLIEKSKPDVILCAHYMAFLVGARLSKRTGIPIVAWYHDVWLGRWLRLFGAAGLMGEIIERASLRVGWDAVIAISQYTANNLIRSGIPPDRIEVIPPIVNVETCEKLPVEIRGAPTICTVGRLVGYKRTGQIIQALAKVRQRVPDTSLVIVGDGPEKGSLESLARSCGVEEAVEFCGYVPGHLDVLRTIKSATLFCSASALEGFGIVLIEAMACRTPVVCADIPVFREVTEDGNRAILFEAGNPEALATSLLRLISDASLRASLQERGAAWSQRYRPEIIAERTVDLFRSIIAVPKREGFQKE